MIKGILCSLVISGNLIPMLYANDLPPHIKRLQEERDRLTQQNLQMLEKNFKDFQSHHQDKKIKCPVANKEEDMTAECLQIEKQSLKFSKQLNSPQIITTNEKLFKIHTELIAYFENKFRTPSSKNHPKH